MSAFQDPLCQLPRLGLLKVVRNILPRCHKAHRRGLASGEGEDCPKCFGLVKLRQDNPGLEVILLSDKMVRFKDLVALLDIFNELGIKNLNIATKTE